MAKKNESGKYRGRVQIGVDKDGKAINDLSLAELQEFSPLFAEDVYEAISILACVRGRNLPGGPAPEAVGAAIAQAEARLERL